MRKLSIFMLATLLAAALAGTCIQDCLAVEEKNGPLPRPQMLAAIRKCSDICNEIFTKASTKFDTPQEKETKQDVKDYEKMISDMRKNLKPTKYLGTSNIVLDAVIEVLVKDVPKHLVKEAKKKIMDVINSFKNKKDKKPEGEQTPEQKPALGGVSAHLKALFNLIKKEFAIEYAKTEAEKEIRKWDHNRQKKTLGGNFLINNAAQSMIKFIRQKISDYTPTNIKELIELFTKLYNEDYSGLKSTRLGDKADDEDEAMRKFWEMWEEMQKKEFEEKKRKQEEAIKEALERERREREKREGKKLGAVKVNLNPKEREAFKRLIEKLVKEESENPKKLEGKVGRIF